MNKFKKGDVVKCVSTRNADFIYLTVGESYIVLNIDEDGDISISDNFNRVEYYYSSNFELDIKAIRNEIIDGILN